MLAQCSDRWLERRNGFHFARRGFNDLWQVITIVLLFIGNWGQSYWHLNSLLLQNLNILELVDVSDRWDGFDLLELGPMSRFATSEVSHCKARVWMRIVFDLTEYVKSDAWFRLLSALVESWLGCMARLRHSIFSRLLASIVLVYHELVIFLVDEALVWEHYLFVATVLASLGLVLTSSCFTLQTRILTLKIVWNLEVLNSSMHLLVERLL